MTVREWYRLQRGALYVNNPELFAAVEGTASQICTQRPPREVIYLGPHAYVCFSDAEVREAELRIRLREDMDTAIAELVRDYLLNRVGARDQSQRCD